VQISGIFVIFPDLVQTASLPAASILMLAELFFERGELAPVGYGVDGKTNVWMRGNPS